MRKTYLTAFSLMLTAGAFATAPSASLAAEGQFYLAPGLQWIDFDEDRGVDEDLGLSLGLGYDFTHRVSGEINIFDMDLEGPGADNDLLEYRADMFYNLTQKIGPLTPFVVGGFGHNEF